MQLASIPDIWQQFWSSSPDSSEYDVFTSLFLLTPLCLFCINERTRSCITDYALDILVKHVRILLNTHVQTVISFSLSECTFYNQTWHLYYSFTDIKTS